jgi:hypothetical protein
MFALIDQPTKTVNELKKKFSSLNNLRDDHLIKLNESIANSINHQNIESFGRGEIEISEEKIKPS